MLSQFEPCNEDTRIHWLYSLQPMDNNGGNNDEAAEERLCPTFRLSLANDTKLQHKHNMNRLNATKEAQEKIQIC